MALQAPAIIIRIVAHDVCIYAREIVEMFENPGKVCIRVLRVVDAFGRSMSLGGACPRFRREKPDRVPAPWVAHHHLVNGVPNKPWITDQNARATPVQRRGVHGIGRAARDAPVMNCCNAGRIGAKADHVLVGAIIDGCPVEIAVEGVRVSGVPSRRGDIEVVKRRGVHHPDAVVNTVVGRRVVEATRRAWIIRLVRPIGHAIGCARWQNRVKREQPSAVSSESAEIERATHAEQGVDARDVRESIVGMAGVRPPVR